MTLTIGGSSVTLPAPQYGYTVTLRMPLRARQISDGTIRHYDPGTAYDARVLSLQWLLTGDEQEDWEELHLNAAGRAATFSLALGASPTGFYPAGPDHGDVGTFTGRLLSWQSSARLEEPYQRTTVEATAVIESWPAYVLPDLVHQGAYTVGYVNGCMAPQAGFKPGYRPSWITEITQGGDPTSVDTGTGSDSWTTEWEQQCNHSHAAAILYMLASVYRGGAFSVETTDTLRPFGDRGAGNTVTARLTSGNVDVSHDEFDSFTVRMAVQMHTLA